MLGYNGKNNSVHEKAIACPSILKALIKLCPDARAIRDAFIEAIRTLKHAAFKILLENATPEALNIPTKRDKPLKAAIENWITFHEYFVFELLEKGADLNIGVDKTPLNLAILAGDLEIVYFLLDKGADFRKAAKDGSLPFVDAHWYPKVIKRMIHMGANIDEADAKGNTAAMKSVLSGSLDTASFLIEHGAKLDGCISKSENVQMRDFLLKFS